MRSPVTDAERKTHVVVHDDPDLAAVKDVLAYYNTRAYYSRQCAEDLAILVKKARGVVSRRDRKGNKEN